VYHGAPSINGGDHEPHALRRRNGGLGKPVDPHRGCAGSRHGTCTSVPLLPAIDIILLSNGVATYCVSDHGWSDAWFIGSAPPVMTRAATCCLATMHPTCTSASAAG
jgi:hypothetical protein